MSISTSKPPVSVNHDYSRASLLRINEPQLIYALFEITPPPEALNREGPPLNVCLILDRSNSMQGERMETVKNTGIEIIHQLRDDDIISVVIFSDRAEVLIPASQAGTVKLVDTQIYAIETHGGTEIYHALEAGFNELSRSYSPNFINHMILITDGRTYGDEDASLHIGEKAAELGMGITCLGIGDEWNDIFLDELALRTGGSVLFISQAEDIQHFLRQQFTGFSQVYAEPVTLGLNFAVGVELNYAFRLTPQAAPLQTTPPLQLGYLPKGQALIFVLELSVPPIASEVELFSLANGFLKIEFPSDPPYTVEIAVSLERPVKDTQDPQPAPTSLLQAVSQLTLYRMGERAQHYLQEGLIAEANLYLNNLATQLFAQGKHELARTVLREIDHVQDTDRLSEEGKKRIKYGTRALIQDLQDSDRSSEKRNDGRGL